MLSETSIFYLIRHASVIHSYWGFSPVKTYTSTSEHCWKKNSGAQRAQTSNRGITVPTRSQLNSPVRTPGGGCLSLEYVLRIRSVS